MVEYINRCRQKYYLYQGKTKTGKPKYFFSMKPEGNSVDAIPDGYEIYENPNSQVFLRKIPLQVITPQEIETVKLGIKKYAKINNAIVDVKGKNIIVYLSDQSLNELMVIGSSANDLGFFRMSDASSFGGNYSPMMQFILEDAETRAFTVERWCFRGSVDGWIGLDNSTDLKKLVQTYTIHLGKESFYDL